ncbi:hypothetical protein pipiens_008859 [Culex pipiens pipiens]|uniref:Uncharacterized protein n=1 Tax=Culex pipiens pipiens TaxID=38569 RepID=A0ABD1DG94_CULPP
MFVLLKSTKESMEESMEESRLASCQGRLFTKNNNIRRANTQPKIFSDVRFITAAINKSLPGPIGLDKCWWRTRNETFDGRTTSVDSIVAELLVKQKIPLTSIIYPACKVDDLGRLMEGEKRFETSYGVEAAQNELILINGTWKRHRLHGQILLQLATIGRGLILQVTLHDNYSGLKPEVPVDAGKKCMMHKHTPWSPDVAPLCLFRASCARGHMITIFVELVPAERCCLNSSTSSCWFEKW